MSSNVTISTSSNNNNNNNKEGETTEEPNNIQTQQHALPLPNTPRRKRSLKEDRVFVIGIAGGSGSGKTTIASALLEEFNQTGRKAGLINMDSYYADLSHLSLKERSAWNFDHPRAFQTDLLVQHIADLKAGKNIFIPVYDFSQHLRRKESIEMDPPRFLIIEGILLFSDERLRNLIDLKIFVDSSSDVRFIRRLRRDLAERGRSVENVCQQYLETVREMHNQFVEPFKNHSHIVIPNDGINGDGNNFNEAVDLILRGFV